MKRLPQKVLAAWIGLALLAPACDLRAEHHIFLVDTSGSMSARPGGRNTQSRIEAAQDALRSFIKKLPLQSTVSLTSFNTSRTDTININLADDVQRGMAGKWITGLKNEAAAGKGTNLWTNLRDLLATASQMATNHKKDAVVLHVLTDGLDTERVTNLDALVADFPHVRLADIKRDTFIPGDIEISVVAGTEAAVSEKHELQIEPSPRPENNSTVPQNPIFELQEPRVIPEGHVLYFANKSLPFAGSFCWIIRRETLTTSKCDPDPVAGNRAESANSPSAAQSVTRSTSISGDGDDVVKLADEHLAYKFQNPDTTPRSYSVTLVAHTPTRSVSAIPIHVQVQPKLEVLEKKANDESQAKLEKVLSGAWKFLGTIGTIVLTEWLRRKINKTSTTAQPHGEESVEKWRLKQRSRTRRALRFLSVLLLLVALYFLWSAWKTYTQEGISEKVLRESQTVMNQSSGVAPVVTSVSPAGAAPQVTIINAPVRPDDGSLSMRGTTQIPPWIVVALIICLLIGVTLLLTPRDRRLGASRFSQSAVLEELQQLDRLDRESILDPKQAAAIRAAILTKIAKHYGVTDPYVMKESAPKK